MARARFPPFRSASLAAGLLAALLTTSASAQTVSPEAEARRTELYKEGVSLANAWNWDAAVARFREVVAIRSAPTALFTLGQAEEHLGHFVAAKRAYVRAEIDATSAGTHDVAEAARKAIGAVDPHIARVTVVRPVATDDATATVDAAPASFGQPVEVDPGEHKVVVSAPQRGLFAETVRVTDGEQRDVNALLEPAANSAPAAASGGSFPLGPVVLGGAGVVAGVVGLVLAIAGESSFNSAEAQCPMNACTNSSALDQGNGARSQIIAGDVVLGVGIAAAAGAAAWWLLSPKKSSSQPATGLVVSPGADGLRVRF